mmetsp:Transcript_2424/g.4812  ORF Transcript_2424/g.4812 Transcript_2424/m.4812 type:complete len:97 (-) Transcript_2424:29-319(-)
MMECLYPKPSCFLVLCGFCGGSVLQAGCYRFRGWGSRYPASISAAVVTAGLKVCFFVSDSGTQVAVVFVKQPGSCRFDEGYKMAHSTIRCCMKNCR